MIYINEAAKVEVDLNNPLIQNALDVYKFTNTKSFTNRAVASCFVNTLNLIADAHEQKEYKETFDVELKPMVENKKVLVLFSGGLDSVYQAINLRKRGYEVQLFHLRNQNKYTNGQEEKVVKLFAEKYSFPLFMGKFTSNDKSEYKKYWQENSWKNFLLYTIAYCYCIENDIGNISSGDDLRLSMSEAVVGTNLSDSKELTTTFIHDMSLNFIACDGDKESRLRFIFDNNLENDYYSCVSPGRMNQYWHNYYSKKFNISQVEKYNCLICRKCAMHLLLRKYYLHNITFDQEAENYLWKKVSIGADNVFFDLSIPLEKRIQNLKDY